VSDEELAKVQDYVTTNGITYPIALGKYDAYGVQGIPHACLIDPKGKVVWDGHPAALPKGTLEGALKGARVPGGLGAGLSSVEKLMRADQYGKAHAEAKRLLAGTSLKPESRTQAEELCADLERSCTEAVDAGLKAVEAQDWATAASQLDTAAKYAGLPRSEEAIAKLAELRTNPAAQKEIQANDKLVQAQALEEGLEFDKAHKAYAAVVSGFAGTKAAAKAGDLKDAIEKAGRLGFQKGCPDCVDQNAACQKHRKKK
jgi:thioredoxin-like negative regulator of GroEL